MTEYNYIALDKTGKQQKGSLVAETERFALEQLRSEGLYPTQLRKSTLLTKDLDVHIGSKVSTRDISVFCRQFARCDYLGSTEHVGTAVRKQASGGSTGECPAGYHEGRDTCCCHAQTGRGIPGTHVEYGGGGRRSR